MATNTVINQQNKGFTLIELMITVAIMAIIAAIAYPSYIDSVRKARRADAQAQMLELASFMERFYTENNRYNKQNNVAQTNVALPTGITSDYYDYALQSVVATSYAIKADPKSGQSTSSCGTLTITNTGLKRPPTCW